MYQKSILEGKFLSKVVLDHVDWLEILHEVSIQESTEKPQHVLFSATDDGLHGLTLVHRVVSLDDT